MATSSDGSRGRRDRVEQLRRADQARQRRRTVLSTALLVVVLVALVVGVYLGTHGHHEKPVAGKQILPSTPTGKVIVEKPPATVPNTSGIPGVIAYDTLGYPAPGSTDAGTLTHDHVVGPVKYAVIPPVGGPHNGVWMNAGVYDKPVPSERAVHDLEHGAIWITYRPDLTAKGVQQLVDFVNKQSMIDEGGKNSNRFMDLSPWQDNALPSPIVLSAWGHQLKVDSPTDSRMQKFVDTFRHNQLYTPEFGAAVDGIPEQTGGRPVSDGSKFANPPGSVDGQGM